ncbi:MAG: ankyrin repeat domain-containing protein [Chloroflexi bacterium]|nr:ankyrin repeat domain-containing protein [Chloroflexota bacterium]
MARSTSSRLRSAAIQRYTELREESWSRTPPNSANFALLVYDFEKYNVIFSITQEHVRAPQGTLALCEMAAQNNVAVLDFLLDRGMDPNFRNEHGVTPLAIAITRGQVDAVKLLLRRGANPNLVYFDTFASLQQAVEQYLLGQDQRIPPMISTYQGDHRGSPGERSRHRPGKAPIVTGWEGQRLEVTLKESGNLAPPLPRRGPNARGGGRFGNSVWQGNGLPNNSMQRTALRAAADAERSARFC